MKKAQLVALVLVLSAFATFIASCTHQGDTGELSDPAVSGDSGIVSDAEQGFPLEKKFFDGTEITVLCVGRHTYGEMQFVSDDEIVANVVNDAVAMRNDLIEEEYGLKIRTVAEDYPVEKLRLAVNSGLDDYDMICDTMMALMPLIPEGLYLPLDGYVDIEREWWDQNANELLTLNDRHYLLSGDAIITDDDYTYLLLFNKEMYDDSDFSAEYGNIYDLVRNGEWTYDVMYEMMRAVSQPDENGSWTENAIYGMVGSVNIGNVFMNAAGLLPCERTSDGGIRISIGDDVNLGTFNSVFDMFSDRTLTMLVEQFSSGGWDIINNSFREGRSLFYSTNASTISVFKNTQEDVISFGVVPTPKYSKDQERYYNTVNSGNSSVLAVASTNVERLEATCYLLELLGYYGKNTPFKLINEAYYETTLKLQAVESDDDAEMLDLIFDSRIYDIYTMMPWGSSPTLGQLYGTVLMSSSDTTVSLLDSKRQSYEAAIEETLEEFAKYN